ncbi:aldo/keto reductase [Ruminococcaceae bacterium OttesenSCG-928-L11]|nr:aldo/keto reductase [Ruminococcaceae bacterium OttesenSCG-928-L11]
MEYRKIGKTSMEASIIGLGAEHLDNKPYEVAEQTIHAALEHGINIMDVFMPGEQVRRNIGKALAGNRDKMLIQGHIGSVDLNQQYDISRDLNVCKQYFEDLLRFLDTDYIDFGMLFFLDSEEAFDKVFHGGIADYAVKLKEQGTIRAIGASSHNPIIARRVVETGLVDLLMFSINPAFDMTPAAQDVLETCGDDFSQRQYTGIDPDRAELYRVCQQREVGITVMKTLGAGKLLSAQHTPFSAPMTVAQCTHYALSRPAVVSALLGCQTAAEVAEAVSYLTLSDEEKDYTGIVGSYKSDFEGSCVYCSHCQPCPVDIDIATVNKYLDIALLDKQNIPPSIRQHYGALAARGSACIACGNCESKCPFGVPVIENMKLAAGLFEA